MKIRYSPPLGGIVAGLGSLFGKKNKSPVFQVDEDGKTLYKEDIISFVLDELERRRLERDPIEKQWVLNANFLMGNQYCDMNPYRGNVEQMKPVYDWLERETFNQIAPLIETRIANLKKINYLMKVNPRTNELDDYKKAEVSTQILQFLQSATDFETKKNTMISWNELCGNCFWLSWWDKEKGEKLSEETLSVQDDEGNVREEKHIIHQGELDYGLISPYEVFPESIFKQTVDAQRSVIIEQVKTADEIYDLYGVKVKGSRIETFELTPIASGGGLGFENTVMSLGHRSVENAERLCTYFERPSRKRPEGRMIIIAGREHIIYYGPLPYSRIPLVQVICRETPGQFFGRSTIEDLIPRQRAYNGCINRIHEYIKRISIGGYLAEEGSVDIEEYEENGQAPGAMLVYKRGSNPPIPVQNGNLPAEIMTERYNLKADMEYVAGTSQLMVNGAVPSGVTSGTAIENLMSIDNTRLSLTGDYIRNSVKNLAVLWLEIYKQYAGAKRIINLTGKNNWSGVLVWSGKDINSFDVEYTTENELIMSEEMQKERFFEAYNMGLFTDSSGKIPERVKIRALEFMKMSNYSGIMNINTLQIQAAQRENVFFENGVIPEGSEFDEHTIHYEEHLRYILQMDFYLLKQKKPEYAEEMIRHLKWHMERFG